MTTIKETLMKMSEEEQSTGDGSLIRRINCPVPVIPRPYARGDEMYDCLVKPLMPFQSTPLREGRPTWLPAMNSDMRFQSTPLREGRRPWPYSVSTACDVSIHAPTRGATHYPIQGEGGHEVSIHAPTRGATRLTVNLLNRVFVSIHAPMRGATPTGRTGRRPIVCFNPRPYARGDCIGYIILIFSLFYFVFRESKVYY